MKKLYLVHTDASYEQVSDVAVHLATRTGHAAFLEEVPDGYAVMAPRRLVWTAWRWWAVFFALGGAAFFFHRVWPTATALQGYGVGWITAVTVLLARRGHA